MSAIDSIFYHDIKEAGISSLAGAKIAAALFETTVQFDSLNNEERISHEELLNDIKVAEDRHKKSGKDALDVIDLSIVLQLAHHVESKGFSSDPAGFHEYQFLPQKFFDVKNNRTNSDIDIMEHYVSDNIQKPYSGFIQRLKNKDSSISAKLFKVIEKTGVDLDVATQCHEKFVQEYKQLIERCRNPLSEENIKFIIEVTRDERKEKVKEAMEFLRDFPEKPNLRECDRYMRLITMDFGDYGNATLAFGLGTYLNGVNGEKNSQLNKVMYSTMISNIGYSGEAGKTDTLPSILRRVLNFQKKIPEGDFQSIKDLNETIDYFTTAYEKVAYARKIEVYRNSNLSVDERVERIRIGLINPRFFNESDREGIKTKFDDYFKNKESFERIKDAVFYGDNVKISGDDITRSKQFLKDLETKVTQVVTKLRDYDNKDVNGKNSKSDDQKDFDILFSSRFHNENGKSLEENWMEKLREHKSYHYGNVYDYLNAFEQQLVKLNNFHQKLVDLETKNFQQRIDDAGEVKYSRDLSVIVKIIPKEIKANSQSKINHENLLALEEHLNKALPNLRFRFSALKDAPLVKVDVDKNNLLIAVQEITPEMISDGFKKAFKNDETKIKEAIAVSENAVSGSIVSLIKSHYHFLGEDDIRTPRSNANLKSRSA